MVPVPLVPWYSVLYAYIYGYKLHEVFKFFSSFFCIIIQRVEKDFFLNLCTSGTDSTTPKAFSRWLMYQYHLGTVNVKYFFFDFQVCFKNRLSFQVPGTKYQYMLHGTRNSHLFLSCQHRRRTIFTFL